MWNRILKQNKINLHSQSKIFLIGIYIRTLSVECGSITFG